jgi:AbrB family looped-hinge helix DNA binding protein
MAKTITYKSEDIFQDIEGDSENVLMNIPPEIASRMGWKPGDVLEIKVVEGSISITKAKNE